MTPSCISGASKPIEIETLTNVFAFIFVSDPFSFFLVYVATIVLHSTVFFTSGSVSVCLLTKILYNRIGLK